MHTNINKCTYKKTCITYKQTYIQTYMSIQTNIHTVYTNKKTYIQTYCCMQTTIHTYIKLKGLAKKNIFIINCASVFNILYRPYKAHLPSDPRMKWWMSRPDDRRGT